MRGVPKIQQKSNLGYAPQPILRTPKNLWNPHTHNCVLKVSIFDAQKFSPISKNE